MASEPGLLILIGLPGSGKSTLARALAARLGLVHIDRDAIRAAMFPQCDFTDAEKRAANSAVRAAAHAVLGRGDGALVDGMTFARRAEREALRGLAREQGRPFCGLYLACEVTTAQQRVDVPGHPARDRDAALVAAVAARFDVPDEPDVTWLDGEAPAAEVLAQALAALSAGV